MTAEAVEAPDVSRETSDATPPADSLPDSKRAPKAPGAEVAVKTPRKRSSSPRRTKRVDIASGMEALYVKVGMGIAMVPSKASASNPAVSVTSAIGLEVASAAKPAGAAWAQLADENDAVRRQLEKILAASTFGLLFAAHLPILVAGAIATGYAPPWIAALMADDEEGDGEKK